MEAQFRNLQRIIHTPNETTSKGIEIDGVIDHSRIYQIFNWIINDSNRNPKDYLKAFNHFSTQLGYPKTNIIELLRKETPDNILKFYAKNQLSEEKESLKEIENYLSENYDTIKQKELLQIDINNHQRILSQAVSHLKSAFPYSKFIDFISNNSADTLNHLILLSSFDISKFKNDGISKLYENKSDSIFSFNHIYLYQENLNLIEKIRKRKSTK